MQLEELAPSPKLCKEIPSGKFVDSVFVWVGDNGNWRMWWRRTIILAVCVEEILPAPTLEEIMRTVPGMCLTCFGDVWEVRCGEMVENDNNPATAALKLWFSVKGIEVKES